ncbi:phasin family protein [Paracraurococcus ruber]|uniref:Phasin domain-containing protein n=1 Tax=Paracraurococcus ruber TaxID=77675 RepID=A0ABS1D4P6_9PROT|nr:phasin family protein [Paracraurococcus ruber]MBK1661779.1 hypothetical protein [Paracraurococcus ruber]TDG29281.1 hypothetical protein E2C05_18280 [Paracraurococcus ruber]
MSKTLFPMLPAMPAGTVVAALMTIQMKNLDALAAAQKAAMDGIGTIARQQQDMLAARLQDVAGLPATLESDPQQAVAKPFDALRTAILDGSARSNMLSELTARTAASVSGILQARLLAALDETKAALLQALPAGKA